MENDQKDDPIDEITGNIYNKYDKKYVKELLKY